MQSPMEGVKVKILYVDGKPHMCTVYPPVTPKEEDYSLGWRPHVRSYHHGSLTQPFDPGGITEYILSKQDKEGD